MWCTLILTVKSVKNSLLDFFPFLIDNKKNNFLIFIYFFFPNRFLCRVDFNYCGHTAAFDLPANVAGFDIFDKLLNNIFFSVKKNSEYYFYELKN